MIVKTVFDNLFLLKFKQFSCNIYLIKLNKKIILIDTGSREVREDLLNYLEKLNFDLKDIVVFNTHSHFDHIGNNVLFEKIFVSLETIELYKRYGSKIAYGGFSNNKDIFKFNIYQTFSNNERLVLDENVFYFIHTPGHSDDSYCIYWEDKGVLFSGDTIFAKGVFGRYDLLTGSLNKLINSVDKLLRLNLDVGILCPGHGILEMDYYNNLKLIQKRLKREIFN